ncbi:MAG TPA: ABC transporter ATP-binding protein [Anaerolineales bacterium]|nr:ABC transporter ATP-binding protein [Anaerolineales bacterium]
MDFSVETIRLNKAFGAIRAVAELDLQVQAGEIYGLLGPNGSGKTTLMRLLVGLAKADKGEVRVLGRLMPDRALLAEVGYMTQAEALYSDLTARENVLFFAALSGVRTASWIGEALELVELQARANDLVGSLSGGLRRRVSLACALVHRPRLLILDEPTVGVDPQLRVAFWEHFRRLAEAGVTLIISSHVMDEAGRCDRLGFMREGWLIAEGSPDELRQRSGMTDLEQAFLKFAEADHAA